MKNIKVQQWGTAVFVIGSIVGTYFFSGPRRRGSSTKLLNEQQRKLDLNLLTPANETFAIVWPIIYSGTMGLAIHQALPSQSGNIRYAQARPWWFVSYSLNLIFGYFFSHQDKANRIGAAFTTIALLPTALGLHRSLEIGQKNVGQPEKTLSRSVSLYAGWLTVATVVSVGNLLVEAGLTPRPDQASRWALGILPVTATLGLGVARQLNDPYFLAPFVAAFTGIWAKQMDKERGLAVMSGVCAVATALAMISQLEKWTTYISKAADERVEESVLLE